MAVRTHYDVLGVASNASHVTIREAYRRLAREHHPDRAAMSTSFSAAGTQRSMPDINEAYRVLFDPGRRAVYDRSLHAAAAPQPQQRSPQPDESARPSPGWSPTDFVQHRDDRPARIPWRMLLLSGSAAIFGIVVLAQFTGAGTDLGPDGILRNGDCVQIEPNTDAREIACTGVDDLVVRAFVPFDGTCPGHTEAHRDRQGMGVACIQRP